MIPATIGKIERRRVVLASRLAERDVVDVDRHDDVAGIDAVGGVARMDAVAGGQCDPVHGNEAVEQVGGGGSGDDLDLVVMPRDRRSRGSASSCGWLGTQAIRRANRRRDFPFSRWAGSSSMRKPGRAKQNGWVRRVHIAVPTK
jgi:hypothetical protein